MQNEKLTKADLAQFTGTENYYRHSFVRTIFYTDGIKYLAENAAAYWLIDEIAFLQMLPKIENQEFQIWQLIVNLAKNTCVLSCEDGNSNVLFSKKIFFTDFPLDEIKIYLVNNVMLLPSEY